MIDEIMCVFLRLLILMISFIICHAAVPKVVAENKHFSKLNSMIQKMNYGRWNVPIGLVHSPEQVFRACVAVRENIDVIKVILSPDTFCP